MSTGIAQGIIASVALKHGLPYRLILQPCKEPQYVAARREIAIKLRGQGWSYPKIGKALGGLHHTAVMHICKKKGPLPKADEWGDGVDEWI